MTWFLHCVPAFINVYPIDSFQHHMIWFLHWVHNWLLSRPFDLIFAFYTKLTPFKTISPAFCIVWHDFWIVYTIDSFQDHLTKLYQCVPNWLLSRPSEWNFTLCTQFTQLTPFKTIWPDFCILYQIDSFQDHMTWFLYCVPNRLLSRPFDLILSLCNQLTPFKTIWHDFCFVNPTDSFQDHLT